MRKVTVYSTVGKKATIIETTATDWTSLKRELSNKSISYSSMKAVVGETRNTLESDKAILPDGDFSLFLMPVKTKSGAGERKALMEAYKANPKAQEHFKAKGLQITRMKTDAIEAELKKVGVSGVVESVKAEKKAPKAEPVKSEKVSSAASAAAKAAKAVTGPSDDYIGLATTKLERLQAKVPAELKDEVQEIIDFVSAGEEAIKIEMRKEEERRAKELDSMAHDIAKDFGDVKQNW